MPVLDRGFFLGPDVVQISRHLLGKHIFTRLPVTRDGSAGLSRAVVTGGIIVETEAYAGPQDRASHAYGNRRTRRTETMFQSGGIAYVYLCYGIHSLLNIVTNVEDIPHAVLVRAIEPTHGIKTMLRRRNLARLEPRLTSGPGALTEALGINVSLDGTALTGRKIWLEDRRRTPPEPRQIAATHRVGVDYAGPDARRPWRFLLRDNPWVSRTRLSKNSVTPNGSAQPRPPSACCQ